ncbi:MULTISPECIES: alpha/beta fold hydrolase [Paenibacillus]|uniref:Alpha/beta fold hydrolase n=1 Tax=Paenibacillus albilobatus TaxID=2716884 RepID=A0A919XG10_9BACL|nr:MULTISPECIES: alpha/beta fold hydrolase [Paenibacillus]GIO32136.1 hypothetical protein J2TS6_32770 [Paenibacillus albilobatus]
MKKNPKTFRNIAAASLALALTVPGAASAAETAPAEAAYAPVRDAAAKLGVQVRWDQAAHTVTLTKGDTMLVLTPGKAQGLLNGKTVQVGGTVQLVSGKTLVPAAFLSGIFSETSGTGGGKEPVASKNAADLFLQALEAGNGAKAAEYMSPAFQKALPVQAINALWGNYEQMYGKTSSNPPVQTERTDAVYRNVSYMLQLGQVPVNVTLRLNADGKVDDMYLGPVSAAGYQKPTYDNPAAYTEQEVRIGNGEMALPGTLTLPQGEGPFPAVVLVHGSGPQDRDSSMGAAKPLRDLAVGLAAKGIAVLRYDKVTYEHTFKVASDPKFTLKKESVDDAVSAVKLLKRTSKIDADRIFVAGHSQGGFAMPLIIDADQDHDVAGAIVLSGPSLGFADTLIDQQQELVARVKKLGQDAAPYEQQAAAWTGIAKLVNDPQYTVDHMPENFPASPAYWWFEQKNYKPVDLAAKQHTPMLILQGENDWQVTMKQFNGWKNALQTRSDVEFKSYPKMNHVLADYGGLSIGTEYAAPSNVSAELISDMAAWIQKHK